MSNKQTVEQGAAVVKTVERTPVKKAGESGTLVYVGPTVPGIVQENTVLNNGIPNRVMEKMAEIPAMKTLLIPVHKLAEAKKALRQQDSAESVCYVKVSEGIGR